MKATKLIITALMLLAFAACSNDNDPAPEPLVEPHDPAFTFRFAENGTLIVSGATPLVNDEFTLNIDNHAWRPVSWNMIKQQGSMGVVDSKPTTVPNHVYFFDKGVVTVLRENAEGKLAHDVVGIRYMEETGEVLTPNGCFGQDVVFRILQMSPDGEQLLTVVPGQQLPKGDSNLSINGGLVYAYVVFQRLSNQDLQALLQKHGLQVID